MAKKPPRTGGKAAPYDYAPPMDERTGGRDALIAVGDGTLTAANVALLANQVSIGVPVPTAAVAVGFTVAKLDHDFRLGREERAAGAPAGFGVGQSPRVYLVQEVEKAKATFEATMVGHIAAAAALDWKAAQYLLEKRAAKRWHEKTVMNIEVNKQSSLSIESMSVDKLLRIARGLLPEEDVREVRSLPSDTVTDAEIVDEDISKADE